MRVQCLVYDITNGMARAMSMMLVGKQVDIVPHTGIVFAGKEYFFGGGICVSPNPGNSIPLKPCQTIDLGETSKTQTELETWLQTQHQEWNQETYNLLSHNCNHFSNAVAKFLGVNEVPGSIVHIADEALSTPRGAQIRQLIEGFDTQMRQSNSGMQLNPFSNVQSGASAPAPAAPAQCTDNAELVEPLKDIAKTSVEEQRACLSTLLTLTRNANNNRTDPKYQKVKMENPAFLKKVSNCSGGMDAMLAIGFIPDTQEGVDYWVMQPERHTQLPSSIAQMEKQLAKLPAAPAPAPTPVAPVRDGPTTSPFPGLGGGAQHNMQHMASHMAQGNPQMMQQAQQMMGNPQMMAQIQQMMQSNPQLMQQAQQMMNDPAALQRLMNQFNQGRPPF